MSVGSDRNTSAPEPANDLTPEPVTPILEDASAPLFLHDHKSVLADSAEAVAPEAVVAEAATLEPDVARAGPAVEPTSDEALWPAASIGAATARPAAQPVAEDASAPEAVDEPEFGDGDGDGGVGARQTAMQELVEIAKTIGYALLIALVLRVLLFQPFTIPSASMEPNLYEGDYIVVSKWDYGYSRHSIPFSPPLIKDRLFGRALKRGDIVVFKLPRDNKTDYIKRVIGLPGDRIQMRSDRLYVNDKPVSDTPLKTVEMQTPYGYVQAETRIREVLPGGRTFTINDYGPDRPLDDTRVFIVPEGHYFMMGDNRDNSIDSRVPESDGVGFVPAENIVGRARMILFSWTPGASLFKPWTWVTHLRPSRFFTPLK